MRHAVVMTSVAFMLAASTSAFATTDGARVPQRKAGYWRLTTVSSAIGMSTIDVCIDAEDSVAAPGEGRTCTAPEVQKFHDETIVDLTCTSRLGEERISTLFTGDFENWYRGVTKLTFDPPQSGVAHLSATVDGKLISDKCPHQTIP